MGQNRHRLLAGAGAAALTTMLAVTAALTARPAEARETDLGLAAFGDLVVDDDHEQVYVSGGPGSNGVVVTDLDGRVIKTINGQFGATGLALSADNHSLYVAQAAGDAISVIDTHTLTEVARHSTGARSCPTHLVRAGERLFFGHGCGNEFNGGVGRVTFPKPPDPSPSPTGSPSASPSGSASSSPRPSSPTPSSATPSSPTPSPSASTPPKPQITLHVQGGARFQRAPLLASAAGTAGTLVAGQPGLSRSTVYVYEVDGAGVLSTKTSGTAPGSNLYDLALDRAGETLFTAAGSRNTTQAYATADLAGRGSYFTGYHPVAVAPAPDDEHIAHGVRTSGDDVFIYHPGDATAERTLDVTSDVLAPRGLAWSADNRTLYAVTEPPAGGAPTLHVVPEYFPDLS